MKKSIILFMIILLIFTLCMPVMAQESIDSNEIYYRNLENSDELIVTDVDTEVMRVDGHFRIGEKSYPASDYAIITKKEIVEYLNGEWPSEAYLPDGQKVDPDKIDLAFDKTRVEIDWKYQDIYEFMIAEDKKAFMDNLGNPKTAEKRYNLEYIIPVCYDGEITGALVKVDYHYYSPKLVGLTEHNEDEYQASVAGVYFVNHPDLKKESMQVKCWNKDDVLEYITQDMNLTGYDVLQTMNVGEEYYAIAQKDDKVYAIVLQWGSTVQASDARKELLEKHSDILSKTVIDAEDMKTLANTYDPAEEKAILKYSELRKDPNYKTLFGGLAEDTEFPYWIIGVIVGVIAIAAVTVIVIKKKKHK